MPNSRGSGPRRSLAPRLPEDRVPVDELRPNEARRLKALDRQLRALEETVDALRPRAERLPSESRETFQGRLESLFREILRMRAEIREALASAGDLEAIAAACRTACGRLESAVETARSDLRQALFGPGGLRSGGDAL